MPLSGLISGSKEMGVYDWPKVRVHNVRREKSKDMMGSQIGAVHYTALSSWDPSEEVLCEAFPDPVCWGHPSLVSLPINKSEPLYYICVFTYLLCKVAEVDDAYRFFSDNWFVSLAHPYRFRSILVSNEGHSQAKWKESRFNSMLHFISQFCWGNGTPSVYPPCSSLDQLFLIILLME